MQNITNQKWKKFYKTTNLVADSTRRRFKQLGCVVRRGQTGAAKKVFEIRPEDTRKVEGTR